MADIFISYKREEQPYARQLADALERRGWSVWWDPKLRAGERFDDVIEAALKEARCVIVMWSRRSVESKYVRDEASYALNRNKLAPIKVEEVDLPFRFERIHTPQLVSWDGSENDPAFKILLRDLTSILGPSPIAKQQRKAAAAKAAFEAEHKVEDKKTQAEEEAAEEAERDAVARAEQEKKNHIKAEKSPPADNEFAKQELVVPSLGSPNIRRRRFPVVGTVLFFFAAIGIGGLLMFEIGNEPEVRRPVASDANAEIPRSQAPTSRPAGKQTSAELSERNISTDVGQRIDERFREIERQKFEQDLEFIKKIDPGAYESMMQRRPGEAIGEVTQEEIDRYKRKLSSMLNMEWEKIINGSQ